jgi:hypothetical protein
VDTGVAGCWRAAVGGCQLAHHVRVRQAHLPLTPSVHQANCMEGGGMCLELGEIGEVSCVRG